MKGYVPNLMKNSNPPPPPVTEKNHEKPTQFVSLLRIELNTSQIKSEVV